MKLILGADDRHIRLNQLVDSWQQIVTGIFDPALFGVCHDQYFSKLDHLVKQIQKLVLHLNKHAHVFASHLLKVSCASTRVLLNQKASGEHCVIPVQNYDILMRFLLLSGCEPDLVIGELTEIPKSDVVHRFTL